MMLVLACALCAAEPTPPAVVAAAGERPRLLKERLSVRHPVDLPGVASSLAPARTEHDGSGGGNDHSGHMGPMWIMMGVMMGVMMVGMGVYLARHASPAQTLGTGASQSPAQLAVPVSPACGGAG